MLLDTDTDTEFIMHLRLDRQMMNNLKYNKEVVQ